MNKSFISILFALSTIFAQVLLSKTIENRGRFYRLTPEAKRLMVKAIPQIVSPDIIMIDNTCYDNIMIVFFKGKLEIYHPPSALIEPEMLKDIFNTVNKEDFIHYMDSDSFVFHAPEITFDGLYFVNAQHCFINAAKSISIDESIIESPYVMLKASEIEIKLTFLAGVQIFELNSNNENSLLSRITFTLKDKTDFDFPMIVMGDADFNNDFMIFFCSGVNKVELQCLPGASYTDDEVVYFNQGVDKI